jgi:hypothetical protein
MYMESDNKVLTNEIQVSMLTTQLLGGEEAGGTSSEPGGTPMLDCTYDVLSGGPSELNSRLGCWISIEHE